MHKFLHNSKREKEVRQGTLGVGPGFGFTGFGFSLVSSTFLDSSGARFPVGFQPVACFYHFWPNGPLLKLGRVLLFVFVLYCF